MKKITFILFALIAGTTFAQETDSDSGIAAVNAEIVSPISISAGSDLNFGRIIGNTAGGDVTIDLSNGRTISADMDVPTTSSAPTTASFDILAAKDYSYSIDIPSIQLLRAGGDPMDVVFNHNLEASGNLGGGSTVQTLKVGGVLSVNPLQLEGDYTADVEVTVAYE